MKVGVATRGGPAGARPAAIRRLVRRFLASGAAELEARPWAEVSVAVLGDEAIRRVNREHLGHDAPTDTISFVYAAAPGADAGLCGEILVNAEQAAREARRRGIKPSVELARYLAHGCQHLCGATDRTRAQRARMNRRETAWLREARRAGLLDALVAEATPWASRPRPSSSYSFSYSRGGMSERARRRGRGREGEP
jgi:probable rRNA maturation factor